MHVLERPRHVLLQLVLQRYDSQESEPALERFVLSCQVQVFLAVVPKCVESLFSLLIEDSHCADHRP